MVQPIGQCLNIIHTSNFEMNEVILTFLNDAHLLRLSVAMAISSEPHSIL